MALDSKDLKAIRAEIDASNAAFSAKAVADPFGVPLDLRIVAGPTVDGAVQVACYQAKHPEAWQFFPAVLQIFAGKLTEKQIATTCANTGCGRDGLLGAAAMGLSLFTKTGSTSDNGYEEGIVGKCLPTELDPASGDYNFTKDSDAIPNTIGMRFGSLERAMRFALSRA